MLVRLTRDPALQAYRRVYCEGRHECCARHEQYTADREPVGDNILPDGRELPDREHDPEGYAAARARAPLPPDEAQRLTALRRYDILDTDAEGTFDELTALASELCGTPIALVSLVDTERQWFKSRVGLDATQTHRDHAFCAHAILDDLPLVVPDATADARFAKNPLVTGALGIRFYAGAPLITPDGYRLGTLCVIDQRPRELDDQQLHALRVLGRQVMSQLELRASLHQLRKENERLIDTRQDVIDALFEVLDEQREEASRRSFLAHVTHELRTPLNGIIGLSEMLMDEDQPIDADRREDLRLIQRAGRHMLELVNGILDLARIESGAVELTPEPVALPELLSTVFALLRPQAQSENNRLVLAIEPGAEDMVTDATKLRQILFNILGNACSYTRDGTITVRAATLTRAGDEYTRLTITDTGVGMTREQLERLFDAFTRFTGSHHRRTMGAGLGMSITKSLVELMKGTINVTSEPGHGTAFIVLLPRRATAARAST